MKYKLPLYPGTIYFFTDKKECEKHLNKHVEEGHDLTGCAGYSIRHGTNFVVGVFDKDDATLVHELAHATFFILGMVGVDTKAGEDNEAFCYLLDHLYTKFKDCHK